MQRNVKAVHHQFYSPNFMSNITMNHNFTFSYNVPRMFYTVDTDAAHLCSRRYRMEYSIETMGSTERSCKLNFTQNINFKIVNLTPNRTVHQLSTMSVFHFHTLFAIQHVPYSWDMLYWWGSHRNCLSEIGKLKC
jgi:hypothetical protein